MHSLAGGIHDQQDDSEIGHASFVTHSTEQQEICKATYNVR